MYSSSDIGRKKTFVVDLCAWQLAQSKTQNLISLISIAMVPDTLHSTQKQVIQFGAVETIMTGLNNLLRSNL